VVIGYEVKKIWEEEVVAHFEIVFYYSVRCSEES
jgi:hypothetical protein